MSWKSRIGWGAALMVLLWTGFSCAAERARMDTLVPAARQAWTGIKADVDRGAALLELKGRAEVAQEETALEHAFVTKLPAEFASVRWTDVLEPAAVAGIKARIESGMLAELSATSLYQRVAAFRAALAKLSEVR